MTQTTPVSADKRATSGLPASASALLSEICKHDSIEKASFHVPGHKGRRWNSDFQKCDLTEVGELDDLSHPSGVLARLERTIASVWAAQHSFLSLNGASGAVTASILAACKPGDRILLPRHVHRSAINALVLGDLEPVWYEGRWDADWGIWEGVDIATLEAHIQSGNLAAVLLVSPRYEGGLEDVPAVARLCKSAGVTLIVDEAHGAHQVGGWHSRSALSQGADLVVHSLHKTLGALTQTGLLHASADCRVSAERIRSSLALVSSSSPSYLFMTSIEAAVTELECFPSLLTDLERLCSDFRTWATENGFEIQALFSGDTLHSLIRRPGGSAAALQEHLIAAGIFPEGVFGEGVLLMMGVGTTSEDIALLQSALAKFEKSETVSSGKQHCKPESIQQVVSPRRAFFANSEEVLSNKAAGRVSAECLASCPPGTPVVVPGQLITESVAAKLPPNRKVRVGVQLQGDA